MGWHRPLAKINNSMNMTQLNKLFWKIDRNMAECSFDGEPEIVLRLNENKFYFNDGFTKIYSSGEQTKSFVWIQTMPLDVSTDYVVNDVWNDLCSSMVHIVSMLMFRLIHANEKYT